MPTIALTVRDIADLPAAVDIATAARAFGISRSKAYELIAAGAFPVPGLRVGNQWRFRGCDIQLKLAGVNDGAA